MLNNFKKKGRKNVYLTTLKSFYFQLFGIRPGTGPFRQQERKPATATTWATLSD